MIGQNVIRWTAVHRIWDDCLWLVRKEYDELWLVEYDKTVCEWPEWSKVGCDWLNMRWLYVIRQCNKTAVIGRIWYNCIDWSKWNKTGCDWLNMIGVKVIYQNEIDCDWSNMGRLFYWSQCNKTGYDRSNVRRRAQYICVVDMHSWYMQLTCPNKMRYSYSQKICDVK